MNALSHDAFLKTVHVCEHWRRPPQKGGARTRSKNKGWTPTYVSIGVYIADPNHEKLFDKFATRDGFDIYIGRRSPKEGFIYVQVPVTSVKCLR